MFLTAMTIYVMQRLSLPLPAVVNNYVNDLLCLPLLRDDLCNPTFKKDNSFTFSIGFVVFWPAIILFYFEYYLPEVNPRYTADWIDVILYFQADLFSSLVKSRKIQDCRDRVLRVNLNYLIR
jgi:hypothetical protein